MRLLMLAALCAATLYGCGDSGPKDSKSKSAPSADSKPDAAAADPGVAAIDAAIAEALSSGKVSKASSTWKTALPKFPSVKLTPGKTYFWDVETNIGSFRAKLFADIAPNHVINTIYLTRFGFYDGVIFHRVIQQFMAQGGDPLGNGSGSPGYKFASEFSPAARHDRPFLLSMANTGQPVSDGSQFFLTFVPTPNLNDKHTIFGEVVEGTETIKAMEALGVPPRSDGPPSQRIEIRKASIRVE